MSNLNDPFKKVTFTDFWEYIGVQGTGKMGRLFFFFELLGCSSYEVIFMRNY